MYNHVLGILSLMHCNLFPLRLKEDNKKRLLNKCMNMTLNIQHTYEIKLKSRMYARYGVCTYNIHIIIHMLYIDIKVYKVTHAHTNIHSIAQFTDRICIPFTCKYVNMHACIS